MNSLVRSSAVFWFGLVLFSFLHAFAPLIENSTQIDLATVPAICWVAAEILAFNIKNPKNKKSISKEAEETFDLIEEARRREISEDELKGESVGRLRHFVLVKLKHLDMDELVNEEDVLQEAYYRGIESIKRGNVIQSTTNWLKFSLL